MTAADAPALRIVKLNKSYVAGKPVLHDISLDFASRGITAIIGPSGTGKSTLVRCINLLVIPTSGRILFGDTDITGLSGSRLRAVRRRIGMVHQEYSLVERLTVMENLLTGRLGYVSAWRAWLRRFPKEDIARAYELLDAVGLGEFANRRADQLSGGQRQRVALARSIAKQPKVLLLDEPLGALDKKLREETQFELMDLQMELGLTFVVVTHDQEEAMTMADRIAIIDKGKIMQVATPADVYEAPNSRFVADFIGNVSTFEGKVASSANGRLDIAANDGFAIRDDSTETYEKGSSVWFAIRPEKLKLSKKKPADTGVNAMEGEVYDIAYLGDMTVFHVKLAGGKVIKISQMNASRAAEEPLGWDDKVWVSFAPDAGIVLRG
jgi:putrescine transport system ATP-binding protein